MKRYHTFDIKISRHLGNVPATATVILCAQHLKLELPPKNFNPTPINLGSEGTIKILISEPKSPKLKMKDLMFCENALFLFSDFQNVNIFDRSFLKQNSGKMLSCLRLAERQTIISYLPTFSAYGVMLFHFIFLFYFEFIVYAFFAIFRALSRIVVLCFILYWQRLFIYRNSWWNIRLYYYHDCRYRFL